MAISYADPTSGPSAGGIGWFDFGNITINPGDNLLNLTGTLSNGVNVTFDLSMALVSGNARPFVATTIPTYPGAYFGTITYTGIGGNVALYNDATDSPLVSSFTFNNIVLTNPDNTPLTNYSVVLADAESTGPTEGFTFVTNGSNWTQLAGDTPPILAGMGTQTATITGTLGLPQYAHVIYTQAPTQVVATVLNGTLSRQAFAIGFATTRVRIQKDVGQRIDPSDQFVLNIGGTPSNQATTTGANDGIQIEIADVGATPLSAYTISESMAPGSASALSDYKQFVSVLNATPAGSVPPSGTLPITFTPVLGDDVTYTILNAAPEIFTKSVDKAFANIGDVLTYTIQVNNPNNFAINNVVVTDATPTGTTYLGNLTVSTAYTGTDLASGLTLTTIAANEVVTITWQVQVNTLPPVSNPIPNYANVSVPGGTSGITNVVMTQVNTAFVTMNKSADKVFAKTGDVITYTIALNNAGNVSANNVTITDAIPAGTTYVPNSIVGATGTPPTFTLIGSVPAMGNASISFKVLVGDTIPLINPITNSATAAYAYTVDPAQPNGATAEASSNTISTQINEALLTMTKSANLAYANLGDIITYTIEVKNDGNVAASNVVLTDAIPAGTTYVAGSLVGASGTPPTLSLANPIAAGDVATVSFQVEVQDALPNPNPLLNTATAAFNFTMDPNSPNGETGTSTSNTVSTTVNNANITTLKTVDKSYADTGSILTYNFTLENTGNVAANNVIINDVIPAGTTFVVGSLTGATGTPPTLTLTAPLAGGTSTNVSFQVQVDESVPQPNPLLNQATTSYTYTVDPANPNGASGSSDSNATSTQINHAEIISTKTVDKAYADLNDILTYTIVLQNLGNVAATSVTLNDIIPSGTTYVDGSLTGATGTLPNVTLQTPIGAGLSSTITFQVKVTSLPIDNPLQNIVTANYKYTVDPVLPNGASATSTSEAASTQVNNATLSISKSANKFVSFLNDTIIFQLAVKNTGNVPANNVVITDTIVNGTAYVPGTLVVSVPFSGTPDTGITLTNPVAAGEVISISFHAKVNTMPLPNPIVNIATLAYNYTVDPADPNGVSKAATSNSVSIPILRNDYQQQINDLIESVALQEAALAAIANAEGAKIQKAVSMMNITTQELLCINKSVEDMMASIALLEAVMKQKISAVDCQINGTC